MFTAIGIPQRSSADLAALYQPLLSSNMEQTLVMLFGCEATQAIRNELTNSSNKSLLLRKE
tara:strand:+ start:6759 stop:6941 length:183 start_codon:yes stop_codon:yes gene_type:complete